ncbi:MAG: serine acetyltransferase [Nitrospirota bacterium]
MKLSLDRNDLADYVSCQTENFFPDKRSGIREAIVRHLDRTLERVAYCFSKIDVKYFREGDDVFFNHLHGDHYAMFLYLLSNTIHRASGDPAACAKLFQLNRALHGIDAFYEVELPEIFLFVHPLGTVLGRASYANYFLVYQQCNVGSNKNVYPTLKEYVSLHPGASVLGSCVVEENCTIGAGSLLLDRNLEKNSVYVGNPKSFSIKESAERNPIWTLN